MNTHTQKENRLMLIIARKANTRNLQDKNMGIKEVGNKQISFFKKKKVHCNDVWVLFTSTKGNRKMVLLPRVKYNF